MKKLDVKKIRKHIGILILYTIIVLGICYLFKDFDRFESVLLIITGILFLMLAGIFMSNLGGGSATMGGSIRPDPNFAYHKAMEKEKNSLDILAIFEYSYIIVPFLLALYFFV